MARIFNQFNKVVIKTQRAAGKLNRQLMLPAHGRIKNIITIIVNNPRCNTAGRTIRTLNILGGSWRCVIRIDIVDIDILERVSRKNTPLAAQTPSQADRTSDLSFSIKGIGSIRIYDRCSKNLSRIEEVNAKRSGCIKQPGLGKSYRETGP